MKILTNIEYSFLKIIWIISLFYWIQTWFLLEIPAIAKIVTVFLLFLFSIIWFWNSNKKSTDNNVGYMLLWFSSIAILWIYWIDYEWIKALTKVVLFWFFWSFIMFLWNIKSIPSILFGGSSIAFLILIAFMWFNSSYFEYLLFTWIGLITLGVLLSTINNIIKNNPVENDEISIYKNNFNYLFNWEKPSHKEKDWEDLLEDNWEKNWEDIDNKDFKEDFNNDFLEKKVKKEKSPEDELKDLFN